MTYLVRYLKPRGEESEENFRTLLIAECRIFQDVCKQLGKRPAIRLPDVDFETGFPALFAEFPRIQFFGFTKNLGRMTRYCKANFPYNYHLTFRSDKEQDCKKVLADIGNVGIVFQGSIPQKHWGYPVHEAEHPLRFLDNWGIIALPSRRTKCG